VSSIKNMKSEILLRPLNESDAKSALEILKKVNAPGLPRWSQVTDAGLGAFIGNDLAGFVLFKTAVDHVDITFLATAPAFQKQGIMTKILKELRKKIPALPFWLEVHENNLTARNFYEKLEFKEVGRRSKYYADNGTAVLYSTSI
jgi:ribosomal protein S18 acetylase RimI-like enzyme